MRVDWGNVRWARTWVTVRIRRISTRNHLIAVERAISVAINTQSTRHA
jgi:hypothetical protein